MTATRTYHCVVCGTDMAVPGCCDACQANMDAEAAARHAAATRALAGDPIAEAIRAHLATLTATDLRAAEHRAQIRTGNAERGAMDTKRLVDLGTLPQASLDAASDEVEAARLTLRLVHEAQQAELQRQREEETPLECALCGPAGSDGPPCDECTHGGREAPYHFGEMEYRRPQQVQP
ncbi:hypothetical protein [Verrucosispora sp. WMMC514]|uniref:hypothetical protein n=1 Tax=Verrucosispora sp. WMMC514 TaxID=3015156 RepID=UPI00248B9B4E|nr:hypothetical protein [Verrucosispora sp. WMMC514]WBB94255.1 hypothetical protein O7597_15500 [Verrucosispora sp. WMMC514]